MSSITLSDQEFALFQDFIYEAAGITLSAAKKALVGGRLAKRVHRCALDSYGAYFRLLSSGTAPDEVQMAVDLLTTNETYFFRESKHFDFLGEQAAAAGRGSQPFRVWSAACSTGEEAWSIAMVLADRLEGRPWEIVGSDISARVLPCARAGHYSMERTSNIPASYLKRFCLKGTGAHQGTLLVEKSLRSRTQFIQVNLNEPLPAMGLFDIVFLRNVMIYFNADTKRQVIARLLAQLKPGGYFLIGHSETLNDLTTAVKAVAPAIYRKPLPGQA
jgi:chemotaxis protein methyltransferase CheR